MRSEIEGHRVGRRRWLGVLTIAGLIAGLMLALLMEAQDTSRGGVGVSASHLAFTRPFLRMIAGAPAPVGNFEGPQGVAVDGSGDLWVGDGPALNRLDEFGPAGSSNGFLASFPAEASTFPENLTIEQSTGRLYVTGKNRESKGAEDIEVFDSGGIPIEQWKLAFSAQAVHVHVAVDNSSDVLEDPSACTVSGCTVYVAHDSEDLDPPAGDGLPAGVEKFDSKGEPVTFTGKAAYIKGNEIVGTENGNFGLYTPGGVAVDGGGDIYVVDYEYTDGTPAVLEYAPSGVFVRAFTGAGTPGLGEYHNYGGFGGQPVGVAVDPLTGHVLVEVGSPGRSKGAVDEFEGHTGKFLDQISETSGGASLHGGFESSELAVDPESDLYVVDGVSHVVDVYGPGHFLAGLTVGEADERKGTSAILDGSVNPEGQTISECYFEYVEEVHYNPATSDPFEAGDKAPCVPAASGIPVDNSSHQVHAALTGLVPGTAYRYRLVAMTAGALGGVAVSVAPAFTTPGAPRIDSTSATNLSSTFADLDAEIDPLGATTTYQFEYVEEARYEAGAEDPYAAGASMPVPAANIGSGGLTGSVAERVVQHVGGLSPGTTYDFRVVASNEIGTQDGPSETFTTLPRVVAGLPDGRAYELVTPSDKYGGSDMFASHPTNGEFFNRHNVGYPSDSGDGFVLETLSAFGPFPASGSNIYVFSRESGGWSFTSLASPSLGVQSIGGAVFDPELSRVGVTDSVGSAVSEGGSRLTGLVGAPGGPYTTLHADPPFHFIESESSKAPEEETEIVAASQDMSRIFLEGNVHSTCPGDGAQDPKSNSLCEWAGGFEMLDEQLEPELRLVNVNNEGLLLNHCGATLGAGNGSEGGGEHNAVSTDGSKVFFTAPDPGAENDGQGCWDTENEEHAPQLYMRSGDETIELSTPEKGASDATGDHYVEYVGASENGSKVFFLTKTELTKQAAELGLHDEELYECEIVEEPEKPKSCKLTRVSTGEAGSPSAATGADVFTVPDISNDGKMVYFTGYGALAKGAAPHNESEDLVNLYRYDTANTTIAYITTINTYDYSRRCDGAVSGVALCPVANWYTTPDGRYLLFATSRELTGYGTAGSCATLPGYGGNGNGHCDELYRYDSDSGDIVCVSCDPSGAPPVSNAEFARSAFSAPDAGPVRAMSDNGEYVFFDTADALVPRDSNGTLDVYEWHEGHIALISSGTDSAPSFFLGTSADAQNVFFGTHAQLVPQDTDTDGDVYDARICKVENPCIAPPSGETAQCEGDACQNPPPSPIDATPNSLTFTGPQNPPNQTKPVKKTTLTNTQKLAIALKACHKKSRHQRKTCETQARKHYTTKFKPGLHKVTKTKRATK
jgi:hypothetical protein